MDVFGAVALRRRNRSAHPLTERPPAGAAMMMRLAAHCQHTPVGVRFV